jgi:hypothetical protein
MATVNLIRQKRAEEMIDHDEEFTSKDGMNWRKETCFSLFEGDLTNSTEIYLLI